VEEAIEEKVGQVLEARIVVVVKRVLSEELPKALSNFATKEDLEELKRQMATKEDVEELKRQMATKEDVEKLKEELQDMRS